jgi:cytochrome c
MLKIFSPRIVIGLCMAITLPACSENAPGQSDRRAGGANDEIHVQATTEAAGTVPAALAQCKACHTFAPDGSNGVGPRLHGVLGRRAGTVPGYTYSKAMANSGLTWTAEQLDRFIENPGQKVPGTKMTFAGVNNPKHRDEIIKYLSSLK